MYFSQLFGSELVHVRVAWLCSYSIIRELQESIPPIPSTCLALIRFGKCPANQALGDLSRTSSAACNLGANHVPATAAPHVCRNFDLVIMTSSRSWLMGPRGTVHKAAALAAPAAGR